MRNVACLLFAILLGARPSFLFAQDSGQEDEALTDEAPSMGEEPPTLSLTSARPDRVEVWVAGELVGKSNIDVVLPGLVSTVELRAHGYEPLMLPLDPEQAPGFVAEGVRLEPLPATLYVTANVDGAEVVIDRSEEGSVELLLPLELEVDADSRLIRVRAPGYTTFIAPLVLEPGKEATIAAVLIERVEDDEDDGEDNDKVEMQLAGSGLSAGLLGAGQGSGAVGASGSGGAAGSGTGAAEEDPAAAETVAEEEPVVADPAAADSGGDEEPEEQLPVEEEVTQQDEPAGEESGEDEAPGVRDTAPGEANRGLRTAGVATASAGAVSLGLGVVFFDAASSARDDRDAAVTEADFVGAQDRARSNSTLSNVFYGVGFAGLAAGSFMWVRGRPRAAAGAATRIDLGPQRVRLTVEF